MLFENFFYLRKIGTILQIFINLLDTGSSSCLFLPFANSKCDPLCTSSCELLSIVVKLTSPCYLKCDPLDCLSLFCSKLISSPKQVAPTSKTTQAYFSLTTRKNYLLRRLLPQLDEVIQERLLCLRLAIVFGFCPPFSMYSSIWFSWRRLLPRLDKAFFRIQIKIVVLLPTGGKITFAKKFSFLSLTF